MPDLRPVESSGVLPSARFEVGEPSVEFAFYLVDLDFGIGFPAVGVGLGGAFVEEFDGAIDFHQAAHFVEGDAVISAFVVVDDGG